MELSRWTGQAVAGRTLQKGLPEAEADAARSRWTTSRRPRTQPPIARRSAPRSWPDANALQAGSHVDSSARFVMPVLISGLVHVRGVTQYSCHTIGRIAGEFVFNVLIFSVLIAWLCGPLRAEVIGHGQEGFLPGHEHPGVARLLQDMPDNGLLLPGFLGSGEMQDHSVA